MLCFLAHLLLVLCFWGFYSSCCYSLITPQLAVYHPNPLLGLFPLSLLCFVTLNFGPSFCPWLVQSKRVGDLFHLSLRKEALSRNAQKVCLFRKENPWPQVCSMIAPTYSTKSFLLPSPQKKQTGQHINAFWTYKHYLFYPVGWTWLLERNACFLCYSFIPRFI